MTRGPEIKPQAEAVMSTETNLDTQRLVSLVVGSYAFSQGSVRVQRRVFDFYHYLHPDHRISSELFVDTIEPLQAKISKIVGGKGHISVSDKTVRSDSLDRLRELQSSLDAPEISHEEGAKLIFQLTREVILSDFGYLCLDGGRPKDDEPDEIYNPFTDDLLSYTCYFALDRDVDGKVIHPQRVPELTYLYQLIGDLITADTELGSVTIDVISNSFARGWQDENTVISHVKRKFKALGINFDEGKADMRHILSEVQKVHNARLAGQEVQV